MVALVDNPDGRDVALMSNRNDTAFVYALGAACADAARSAAKSYTRGVGFEDDEKIPESLKFAIIARAVRMANNYLQLQNQSTDGVSVNYGAGAYGWLTGELVALDEFRRTACSI